MLTTLVSTVDKLDKPWDTWLVCQQIHISLAPLLMLNFGLLLKMVLAKTTTWELDAKSLTSTWFQDTPMELSELSHSQEELTMVNNSSRWETHGESTNILDHGLRNLHFGPLTTESKPKTTELLISVNSGFLLTNGEWITHTSPWTTSIQTGKSNPTKEPTSHGILLGDSLTPG